MSAVTMRYVDSGDTDSGDTSDGEQLSAPWSDLHPDIPLASGLVPALVWASVAALLLWFLDMPWHDALTIAGTGDAAALVLLTVVAVAVSFLGFRAARRSRRAARSEAEAARRVAEADRMRAALLATLSHDLRSPLAAAKTAVSGLRAADIRLTADDRGELLAAADESLD